MSDTLQFEYQDFLDIISQIKTTELEIVMVKLEIDAETQRILLWTRHPDNYGDNGKPLPMNLIEKLYLSIGTPESDYKLRGLRMKLGQLEAVKAEQKSIQYAMMDSNEIWKAKYYRETKLMGT